MLRDRLREYRFTGKERDTESGNDYAQARYYASVTGRFLSPDPSVFMFADKANPQSLNLYGYVMNNPLSNIDPTGLNTQCAVSVAIDPDTGKPIAAPPHSGHCNSDDQDDGLVHMLRTDEFLYMEFDNMVAPSNSPAHPNTPSKAGCFVKGLAHGAVGGLVIAGGTALASTVLAPEVVTAGLLGAGAYGGYQLYKSIRSNLSSRNGSGLAYNAGSLLGGAAVGGATSYGVRYSITGETGGPSGLLDFSGLMKLTNPFRAGNSILGNLRAAFAKGPDLLGGGAAIAGGAGYGQGGCQQ